jgi:hypothetical protein
MEPTVAEIVDFIRDQLPRQQAWFGAAAADKVVAHVATTGLPGTQASVSCHRLLGLERGASPAELVARLAGALPRAPQPGEIVSVCVSDQAAGYQVKTRLAPSAPALQATEGGTLVRGSTVYTLHHSPFMMTAFERVPVEEVLATVGRARFAIAAVGPQVNVSPRFCFHHEVRDGRLILFHGDGLPLKTYLNLRQNPAVVRVLVDPERFEGFLLEGPVEEVTDREEAAACAAVTRGFATGGWGRPARFFRFQAERLRRVAPVG